MFNKHLDINLYDLKYLKYLKYKATYSALKIQ